MNQNPNLYRAGVYLELQRFYNPGKKNRGLKFSVAELRALSALTALLDRHNYKGTEAPLEIKKKDFADMEAPVLTFRWKEYLQLFYGTSQFWGQQPDTAKEALRTIPKTEGTIAYYRRKGRDPNKRKFIIDHHPLIKVKTESKKRVTVAYHPIFIDNIYSFHTWKPINLYHIVADFLHTYKVKKAVILFLEWLMTKNTSHYNDIHKSDLIKRLWLWETWEDMRQKTRVERTLAQCFETARMLGFLKSEVTVDDFGKYHFELNEARCSRIKIKERNKPE
jgi:hypothetical protein